MKKNQIKNYETEALKQEGNTIKCLECGKILVSTFRHDFQACDCSNESFVDGGKTYLRVGGMDLDKIKVLRAWKDGKLTYKDPEI